MPCFTRDCDTKPKWVTCTSDAFEIAIKAWGRFGLSTTGWPYLWGRQKLASYQYLVKSLVPGFRQCQWCSIITWAQKSFTLVSWWVLACVFPSSVAESICVVDTITFTASRVMLRCQLRSSLAPGHLMTFRLGLPFSFGGWLSSLACQAVLRGMV